MADSSRIREFPRPSTGVGSDIAQFFLHAPPIDTLIPIDSARSRSEYEQRILQRLPIDVRDYSILNIHRIGIEAPVSLVFEESLKWSGASPCWPNHIATVESADESGVAIRILLLGSWTKRLRRGFSQSKSNLGLLFRLTEIKRQVDPHPDSDNARYLLYECSGGYPIGIFCIYVRSSLESLGEREQSQVFFAVSFNFFGLRPSRLTRGLSRIWQGVHNRVTANVLDRFKQICEAEFESIEMGAPTEAHSTNQDRRTLVGFR